MISKVTIQVAWWDLGKNRTRIEITPGNVENVVGDGMPLSMYMSILKALQLVEEEINRKTEPPVKTPAHQPRIEVPAVSKDETSTPPHRKQ